MKKLLLSILVLIMLFNLVGPQLVFSVKENKAINSIENKIANMQYNEAELTEIKIPLNMPYYSDMEENVAYGETTIDGKYYRYVKRKVENNVLHLYCLPNVSKNQLESDKVALAKENTKKENNKNNYKFFGFDYFYESQISDDNVVFKTTKEKFPTYSENIDDLFLLTTYQPPEQG